MKKKRLNQKLVFNTEEMNISPRSRKCERPTHPNTYTCQAKDTCWTCVC